MDISGPCGINSNVFTILDALIHCISKSLSVRILAANVVDIYVDGIRTPDPNVPNFLSHVYKNFMRVSSF